MALHNYACIVEFSLSHSHRYMHVQNSHITNWNGIFSFLYLIFENCWSGQLLSNETIALDHWKICVLCRLHKKVFVSPQKFVSSECRDLCSWFWHGCKSEQNNIIMFIVVILAPIDLRWQWQYKIVACATFCLKVKILKQVIIKWQWQWQWQWHFQYFTMSYCGVSSKCKDVKELSGSKKTHSHRVVTESWAIDSTMSCTPLPSSPLQRVTNHCARWCKEI